jgi:DNA polymerase III delta prime subunit
MFPTILFSNEPSTTEKYINDFIKQHFFNPSSIFKIEPKEKTIIIEQIRDLTSQLRIKSPSKRLICIYAFDTATIEAQNAMLKLLEEKTADNQFILIVSDIQKIVPTVISRCRIADLFVERTEIDTQVSDVIEKSFKNPGIDLLGSAYFQPGTREEATDLFRKIIIVLQKKIRSGDIRAAKLAKKAFDLLHKLESNNLNFQLAVDSFVIELMRKA